MLTWLSYFQRFGQNFVRGAGVTLELTAVGLAIGFVLGLLLALARSYGPKWLQQVAGAYIAVFRGTPLLVQLFIIYYGFPEIWAVDRAVQVADDWLCHFAPGTAAGAAELVQRTDFAAEDHRHCLFNCSAGPDGGRQARRHHHL